MLNAIEVRVEQLLVTIEPRHFGAPSGFGQICLRAGEYGSALLAFEHAIVVNPNLDSVRQAAEVLRRQNPPTIH